MTTGGVDDYGRALLPITVYHAETSATMVIEAWIDTGFTGALLLTQSQIAALALARSAGAPGQLADGSRIVFETFLCVLDWFGQRRPLETIAGSGHFALLGVSLLEDCTVVIDYPNRKVTVTSLPQPPPTP
jgi:clan AA aspartic protease